jgi:DNA-binding response OmpR family regulator
MNILVVEPDAVLGKVYAQAFERKGHSVSCARNAQAAVLAADAKRPDVVVLELQLAAHSGAAFLYEFRSYTDWLHIPVVVHSLMPPDRLQLFEQAFTELGVAKQLYKPATSLRQLIDAVEGSAAVTVR